MSKAALRTRARERRAAACSPEGQVRLAQVLSEALVPFAGQPLAGYLPIQSEADPRAVMSDWSAPVGVPVVEAPARPLSFVRWTPDAALERGAFGVAVPADRQPMEPRVVLVPLLAFDAQGGRLGYGGGFYDRTLALLRARGEVTALGLAFAAQEVAQVPLEPTDAPLDGIVTEAGLRRF